VVGGGVGEGSVVGGSVVGGGWVVGAVIACLDPPDSLVEAASETLRQLGGAAAPGGAQTGGAQTGVAQTGVAQTGVAQIRVVAVDDGSAAPEAAAVFAALAALGVDVLHQSNGGIAAALNAGITRLREPVDGGSGPAFVLTLDQDSRLGPGYVAAALAAVAALEAEGTPYGFVASESYSGRRAPTDGPVPGVPALRRAFDPMQSGWVVPVTTFAQVGLLDEALVIDGVDSEFTVRCRAAGLTPVVAPGAALEHGQGERVPGRLLGRTVGAVNHHSPTRVRYMARNGVLITRRYAAAQPRWVARRLLEEAKAHLLRVVLDPDRRRLAAAMLRGWRDGVLGRSGPLIPPAT